ncbi:hypothetical protein RIF29_31113 [Crotalaria pallida]|uniref:Uncharacterized protein n=1 Tax=Crotalaria pallida TaxID=3830 RepID=A0AAN9EM40_CROPI
MASTYERFHFLLFQFCTSGRQSVLMKAWVIPKSSRSSRVQRRQKPSAIVASEVSGGLRKTAVCSLLQPSMDSRKTNNPHSDNGASPGYVREVRRDNGLGDNEGSAHGSTQGFRHSGDPSFLGIMVEIKRTIPKGSSQSNDFKTKKIFIGGIPTIVSVVLEI